MTTRNIALHEAGHALAAYVFGIAVRSVSVNASRTPTSMYKFLAAAVPGCRRSHPLPAGRHRLLSRIPPPWNAVDIVGDVWISRARDEPALVKIAASTEDVHVVPRSGPGLVQPLPTGNLTLTPTYKDTRRRSAATKPRWRVSNRPARSIKRILQPRGGMRGCRAAQRSVLMGSRNLKRASSR